MTRQIANILRQLLADNVNDGVDADGIALPNGLLYIDKMAGLVQVGEKVQPTEINGAFSVTKFPISLDSDYEECIRSGCYTDLVPNSKLKGILYFEDFGTIIIKRQHGDIYYRSTLRLICWINNKLIQGDNCNSITHKIVTHILSILEVNNLNQDDFKRITVNAAKIYENDINLFAKYSYPSESVKFLMHPYEAFGIDLVVEYAVSKSCIGDIILNPAIC